MRRRFVRFATLLVVLGSMCFGAPAFAKDDAIAKLDAVRGGVTAIRGWGLQDPIFHMALQRDDQPTNTTPTQPRLGGSNRFVVSTGGPGLRSFNEFNPPFDKTAPTCWQQGSQAMMGSGVARQSLPPSSTKPRRHKDIHKED